MVGLTSPAAPSRRAVVGAALWSAPAITLATAAPAFADSGRPALEFDAVDTYVNSRGTLVIDMASVTAVGRSIPAAQVLMTVTFQADSGGAPVVLRMEEPIPGWQRTGAAKGLQLEFVSLSTVASGVPLSLDSGGRVAQEVGFQGGTYHLQFTATDYVQAMYSSALYTPDDD